MFGKQICKPSGNPVWDGGGVCLYILSNKTANMVGLSAVRVHKRRTKLLTEPFNPSYEVIYTCILR
jgi:hypothetical protein